MGFIFAKLECFGVPVVFQYKTVIYEKQHDNTRCFDSIYSGKLSFCCCFVCCIDDQQTIFQGFIRWQWVAMGGNGWQRRFDPKPRDCSFHTISPIN